MGICPRSLRGAWNRRRGVMQIRAAWPIRCVSRTAGGCAGSGSGGAGRGNLPHGRSPSIRCGRFVTNGHVRAHCDRRIGGPRTGAYPEAQRARMPAPYGDEGGMGAGRAPMMPSASASTMRSKRSRRTLSKRLPGKVQRHGQGHEQDHEPARRTTMSDVANFPTPHAVAVDWDAPHLQKLLQRVQSWQLDQRGGHAPQAVCLFLGWNRGRGCWCGGTSTRWCCRRRIRCRWASASASSGRTSPRASGARWCRAGRGSARATPNRASGSTGCGSTHSITERPRQEGAPILAAQATGSVPSRGGCTGIPCPRTREDLYADRAGGAPSERWPIRGADLGAAAPRRTTRGISGVPVADPAMVRIRPPAAGGPAGSPAPRRIRVRAGTAAEPRFRRPRQ